MAYKVKKGKEALKVKEYQMLKPIEQLFTETNETFGKTLSFSYWLPKRAKIS